jgi:hypothetical protein
MSHRLQVLIPEDLDARIRKAAQRLRMSKGEWVRHAMEAALAADSLRVSEGHDPLARLEALEAPTGDVDTMISEIESGRA